ncbi:hypothetical protein I4U23_022788 [Adineta vaga]|nr:hypothetical protein I4U23_022788 [Adineta vaga]
MTKEITKKRIIELSIHYNILSPHTAFVGVKKRVNSNNTDMILCEVPIQISVDDQHSKVHSTRSYSEILEMLERMTARGINSDGILDRPSLHLNPSYYSTPYSEASAFASSFMRNILNDNSQIQPSRNTRSTFDFLDGMLHNNVNIQQSGEIWPTNNQDIVRHLITKQKFDGSWDLDSNTIKRLTGCSLSKFQHLANN